MDSTPGGSTDDELYISRKTLINYYRDCSSRANEDKMAFLFDKVQSALRLTYLPQTIKDILRKLISIYKEKLQNVHRNFKRFTDKNKDWFESYISFSVPKHYERKRESEKPGGRPSKNFEESSERTKRRKTEKVRQKMTPEELAYAAQMEFRTRGEITKSKLIKQVSVGESITASVSHKTLSSEKALSLLIESKLTKFQYNMMRESAMSENCNLYPNYETITEEKKRCYPEGISVTETKAEVPLQPLLDHTCERLLRSLHEVIETLSYQQKSNLCLETKWGCDGSGSHSQYKQKFQNLDASDENMFLTSMVPVTLLYRMENASSKVIWQNPRPSSTRYCRPIRLQMAHETAELSRLEYNDIKEQLSKVNATSVYGCVVKHNMHMTMVDGKMVNALTDTTSAQRCYICGITSKDFNCLRLCISKPTKEENFSFGISPLHAWIRLAECILHIAYKLNIEKWQTRRPTDKKTVQAEKKRIQKEFWEKLGLHVDKPRQGGGTSTDGNTARAIFRHSEETAEITGIHINTIRRFHVILQVLSSGHKVNQTKFKKYCHTTASDFVFKYPWYYMPTTLHKILIHGGDIVESSEIAIGLLSEDAQESRNKDLRNYREHFSRKFSRKVTLEDTFKRLLVSSDPHITGLRKLRSNKSSSLPPAVLDMLAIEINE